MTSRLRLDFEGTPNDDILVGGDEISIISGGGGDDLLVGAQGQDVLKGGDGDDILIGGGLRSGHWDVSTDLGETYVLEIAWFDEPHPRFFSELLIGGRGNDLIIGGSWDDTGDDGEYHNAGASAFAELIFDGTGVLGDGGSNVSGPVGHARFGEGFNNVVWAGEGQDTVFGAGGFDTIGGGRGDDVLYGLGGADIIYGGAGDDKIYGGHGDTQSFHRELVEPLSVTQTLYGGAGDDDVWGGDGADILSGGVGNDRLYGREGDDTLKGGAGGDYLIGGEGNDRYTLGDGADSVYFYFDGSSDTVTDFDLDDDRIVIDEYLLEDDFMDGLANAVETTQDGVSGLLIGTSDGMLFLAGLGTADIDSIEVVVFYPD